MLESAERPQEDMHLNPDPNKDENYWDKVRQNAAEDKEEGDSNPNYQAKSN